MVDFCDDALGAFSLLDRAPLGSGPSTVSAWGPPASKLPPGEIPGPRPKPAKKKVRKASDVQEMKAASMRKAEGVAGGVRADGQGTESYVELLPPENDAGKIEYKLKLINVPPSRFQHLVSQLLFRLAEGNGEALYKLGVTDGGFPQGLSEPDLQASIWTVRQMSEQLRCTIASITYHPGVTGRWAELRVKHIIANALGCPSVRVAVAGATDAGKSTLIAVLTRGGRGDPLLDDGRGGARMAVVRHKHEIQSGRTSSRSLHHIGYTNEGLPLNYTAVAALDAAAATALGGSGDNHLAAIVSFVELCGHDKYAKTALFGLTCLRPHVLCLVLSPHTAQADSHHQLPGDAAEQTADPLTPMGRQHLAAALALRIPAFAIVAKTDTADDLSQPPPPRTPGAEEAVRAGAGALARVRVALAAVAGRGGDVDAAAPLVTTREQAQRVAADLSAQLASTSAGADAIAAESFARSFPVFPVSCVSGQGLPQLHAFLAALPQSRPREGTSRVGSLIAETPAEAAGVPTRVDGVSAVDSVKTPTSDAPTTPPPTHPCFADGNTPRECSAGSAGDVTAAGSESGSSPCAAGVEDDAEKPAAGEWGRDSEASSKDLDPVLQVEQVLEVGGRRFVAAGVLTQGRVQIGDELVLGPLGKTRAFASVRVVNIRCSHVPVRCLFAGQAATLQLEPPNGWPGDAPSLSPLDRIHAAWSAPDLTSEPSAADHTAAATRNGSKRGLVSPGPDGDDLGEMRAPCEGATDHAFGVSASSMHRVSADESGDSLRDGSESATREFRVVSSCAEMGNGGAGPGPTSSAAGAFVRRGGCSSAAGASLLRRISRDRSGRGSGVGGITAAGGLSIGSLLLAGESSAGGSGSDMDSLPSACFTTRRADAAAARVAARRASLSGLTGRQECRSNTFDDWGGFPGLGCLAARSREGSEAAPLLAADSAPLGEDNEDALWEVTTVLLEEPETASCHWGSALSPATGPTSDDEGCVGGPATTRRAAAQARRALGEGAEQIGTAARTSGAAPGRRPSADTGEQPPRGAGPSEEGRQGSGTGRRRQQKGLILAHPRVVARNPPSWEFDAALVILSEHSGASSGIPLAGAAAAAAGDGASSPGPLVHDRKGQMLVCCGSVRQAVEIVGWSSVLSAHDRTGSSLRRGAVAAAAVLSLGGPCAMTTAPSGGADARVPALQGALARFRFVHKPEWVSAGAIFLVADLATGRLFASGHITAPVAVT